MNARDASFELDPAPPPTRVPRSPDALAGGSARPVTVVGFLGTKLDRAGRQDRWSRWRPTVSLAQHDDLIVDRLVLLHLGRSDALVRTLASDIQAVSPETTIEPVHLSIEDPWDLAAVYTALTEFAGTGALDPEREELLFHITTGTHVMQICMFLMTESRAFPGQLIQTGPPRAGGPTAGQYRIIDLDLAAYDELAARFEREHADAVTSLKSGIDTRNATFNRLIERIEFVAGRTTDAMLITGPTGAGKSRLAGRIHDLRRAKRLVDGDLVEVNCATLRGDMAMSTLFGHTAGSFTGASGERAGLLRQADGGMLFLDEIGELGLDEQAMLLRAVEDGRFLPIGADTEVTSDFQLIAGTNRDLGEAVRNGRFREDLLARINLWTFELPALRDRPEDIEPNLAFELERFAKDQGKQVRFASAARDRFLRFATAPDAAWTGNFRDLGAAVRRMATLAPGGRITAETVDEEIGRLQAGWAGSSGGHAAGTSAHAGDVAGLATQLTAELNGVLSPDQIAEIDPFDHAGLLLAVRTCRRARSLSEAGRTLFAVSRTRRASTNDADRLRKFLARFGVSWDVLHAG
ncbi:MAG: RNA repair transcriptional activator RtcR [Phycisphaerales bacterium]